LPKRFVVDTSVLLYDIDALYQFEDNEVIIPSVVYEEINVLKEENSERGYYARRIAELLDALSATASLKKGVQLGTTTIRTSYAIQNNNLKKSLTMKKTDYYIIACAINENAILITRDRMMRVIARDFVQAEEYIADMVSKDVFKGYRRKRVNASVIDSLYQHTLSNDDGLFQNEFLILEDEAYPQHVGIGIAKGAQILPVDFDKTLFYTGMKTRALNIEQKMFLYLLQDPEVLCVSVVGTSGRGKTLLAVDVALANVQRKQYDRFVYTKSVIPVDKREELGFYQGSVTEKFLQHVRPLTSAVEYLYREELYHGKTRIPLEKKMEELMNADILDIVPLANIRGMSVYGQWVMLDEAQNTNPHTMKTLVTRINDNSKLVVVGDIEQIDDMNLNAYNNGLAHLVQEGKEEPFIAHIQMDIDPKSRRGKLAEFGTKKL
jgi:PhoH-like ATPase